MSASLVGSEMCIRDRRGTHSMYPVGPSSRHSLAGGPLKARRHLLAGPVSYTHLTLPTICSV
eukprot:4990591-Alexandrium_andersonii.AAC.1